MEEHSTVNEKLWMLVEMDSYGGKNNYTVVDSDEVIGHPSKDNMHTGKTVKIRKGKVTVPATVVIISDDREFLETELKQLKKMAAANLISQNIQTNFDEQKCSKRRRVGNDIGTLHIYQQPQQPQLHQPHLPQQQQQQHVSWQMSPPQMVTNNNGHKERIMLPSTSTVNQQTFIAPPMTFDQQTQTDQKQLGDDVSAFVINQFSAQLNQLLANQEIEAEKQKQFADESLANQKVIYDLIDEFRLMKNELVEMNSKLAKITSMNDEEQQEETMYIMEGSEQEQQQSLSNETVASYNIDSSGGVVMAENHEVSKDEIIISFENDVSNQSIPNTTASRLSLNEATNSCFSSVSEFNNGSLQNGGQRSLNASLSPSVKVLNNISVSNTSLNGSIASQSNCSIVDNIIQEWSKDDTRSEGDDEFVTIGSNKTQVPKHIIRSINWNSHTAATRKLLMALFPRSVLATHSLTGKPSPGNYKIINIFSNKNIQIYLVNDFLF